MYKPTNPCGYMQKLEIKTRIQQINNELEAILQDDRRIKSSSYDQWMKDLLLDMNENGVGSWPWAKLIDSVSRKQLLREKDLLENKPLPEGLVGLREIEMAKQIPIGQLLEFNRAGFAKCLWHNDTNPSMKWFKKNNKAHCFACGKSVDSVDIVKKLYNLNLPQAVKRMLNV